MPGSCWHPGQRGRHKLPSRPCRARASLACKPLRQAALRSKGWQCRLRSGSLPSFQAWLRRACEEGAGLCEVNMRQ